jgi:hypothetical protein
VRDISWSNGVPIARVSAGRQAEFELRYRCDTKFWSCAGTTGRPLLQSFAQRLRRPQKSCGSPWRSITSLSEEGEGDAHPCGRSEASPSVRSCHNHVRREHPLSDEEVVPLATNRFAICCLIRLGRIACCCSRINSSLVQDASCDHQPEHDRSSGDSTRPANASS